MSRLVLTGLLSLTIVAGTLLVGSAASSVLPGAGAPDAEAESESETERESEAESEPESEWESETETEEDFLQAPDLVLTGTVIGGGSGRITIQTEDGASYEVSFVDALTDFSDSGLNDGMRVECTLKDTTSDADGIFYADQIRTVQAWN